MLRPLRASFAPFFRLLPVSPSKRDLEGGRLPCATLAPNQFRGYHAQRALLSDSRSDSGSGLAAYVVRQRPVKLGLFGRPHHSHSIWSGARRPAVRCRVALSSRSPRSLLHSSVTDPRGFLVQPRRHGLDLRKQAPRAAAVSLLPGCRCRRNCRGRRQYRL
jgi:hypothetical protein